MSKIYTQPPSRLHNYTFSIFLKGSKNYLKILDFWHPLISPAQIVTNSIRLSQRKNKTVLITGPNAGGKSTVIKSIILAAYLSQTLTLSPCRQVKLSPFDIMESYFNVPDITGYKSMFEAELYRSKNYLDTLRRSPDLKSLIVLDEIFNSTSPIEGISCSHAIIKRLNQSPNNFSLVTTHYHYLTTLDDCRTISNYHVKATKDDEFFHFPYKIYKGPSEQNIALELLKVKNFDSHIITDAIAMKEKLTLLKKGIL